jgi:hypothetical protein
MRMNSTTSVLLLLATASLRCSTWSDTVQAQATSAQTQQTADEPGDDEPLAYQIARRGTARWDDAFRLFLALAADQDRIKPSEEAATISFEQLTSHLRVLGVIDPTWSCAADTHLRRDVLAYMCSAYMGCRPGILTGVCGRTRRYAHRDMVYRGIIPPGPPGTFVSGPELLAVVTRVEAATSQRSDVNLKEDEIR